MFPKSQKINIWKWLRIITHFRIFFQPPHFWVLSISDVFYFSRLFFEFIRVYQKRAFLISDPPLLLTTSLWLCRAGGSQGNSVVLFRSRYDPVTFCDGFISQQWFRWSRLANTIWVELKTDLDNFCGHQEN